MVERLAAGWTVTAVARALGTSPRTVRQWRDRSSRPHRSPTRLDADAEAEIAALRRQRLCGPAIARQLGRPPSTVGVALRRLGLGRLAALDPPRQVIRYERERPGELIHIDTKKRGRREGLGWAGLGVSPRRHWNGPQFDRTVGATVRAWA